MFLKIFFVVVPFVAIPVMALVFTGVLAVIFGGLPLDMGIVLSAPLSLILLWTMVELCDYCWREVRRSREG